MSIWSNISGTVKIKKSDNISVDMVIRDTFNCEYILNLKTDNELDLYCHRIDCNLRIDAYDFLKCHEKFLKSLKPIKKSV